MGNYSELLKDPRWQKKRLEILSLDFWRCRHCYNKEKTLHVHHLYYESGRDPWDYPNDALITLCEACHERVPNIDWRRAFLDLNITEFELLDIALQLRFRKEKEAIILSEWMEKYKCRQMDPFGWYDLFKDGDEVDEYYKSFVQQYKPNYTNG